MLPLLALGILLPAWEVAYRLCHRSTPDYPYLVVHFPFVLPMRQTGGIAPAFGKTKKFVANITSGLSRAGIHISRTNKAFYSGQHRDTLSLEASFRNNHK
jgi:hypothetical protein